MSRTFYARGQTGQQLLLGAYSALSRQVAVGKVKMYNRHELLDIVKIDGKARGVVVRNNATGEISSHGGHAVLLCNGGYGNVFYLSTNAMDPMLQPLGERTSAVPSLQTHRSRKYTQLVFLYRETISQNLP